MVEQKNIQLDTLQLERVVLEVFGGCNYTCKMCPQGSEEGRETSFLRKMPLNMFSSILDEITPKYGYPLVNLEGSGEPTMVKNLAMYINECSKRKLKSFIYCNGSNFNGKLMRDSIDAGLSMIRFSVIGYNAVEYEKWMSKDNWDLIISNIIETRDYIKQTGSTCKVESYHLILDSDAIEYEIEQYKTNFIDKVGVDAYIWKMHNWSGNINLASRVGEKQSCGRPFAAELTVRAGGINGQTGAVTPCCQVLGPPTESASVLGHFSNQSFEEIWDGELYNNLRNAHATQNFDSIDYCKNCDFLLSDPDVLVWSSNETTIGQPLGTSLKLNR